MPETRVGVALDRELERAQAALLARFAPDAQVRRLRWSQGETQLFDLGTGPPLVYVHGGLSGAFEVVPILGALAQNHRVLAVDRPGHGLADPFDYRGVDLPGHARTFLGDVLDALDLEAPAVVANSIGAYFAVALALDTPRRVSRLAIVGAPFGLARRPPSAAASARAPGHRATPRPARVLECDARRKPEVLRPGPRRASRENRRSAARRRRRELPAKRREHARPGRAHRRFPEARVPTRADARRALARPDDGDAVRLGRAGRLRIARARRGPRREESPPSPRPGCRGRAPSGG